MRDAWRAVAIPVLAALLGCAGRRLPGPATQAMHAAATRPADSSLLTLEQIEPAPVLGQPSTQPSGPAPLEAIQLYAQARSQQLQGDRSGAISLLTRALEKDPHCFDLHFALGVAHLGTGTAGIKHLERAAELRPDHLETRLHLGQQYLARHDLDRAMHHLRLATVTADYRRHPEDAARVDFFLARVLQQKGYEIAALSQYEKFLDRMEGRLNVRGNPQLFYLVSRPQLVLMEVGQLAEKHGQLERALGSYRQAAEREPNNFVFQSHIARILVKLRRYSDARQLVADLVVGHRASRDSVALMREVYVAGGKGASVTDELRQILTKRQGDRSILFALAEILAASGREPEAERLLAAELAKSPGEASVVRRLFDLYQNRHDTSAAAKLVVEALAAAPDSLEEMEALWDRLLRDARRLRMSTVQELQVLPEARASKLYWVARMADIWSRSSLARASLEQAVSIEPPFAPAYRQLLVSYLRRPEWSDRQRGEAAERLIDQAGRRGLTGFAQELKGLLLLSQKKSAEAVDAFRKAIAEGHRSRSMQLLLAMALDAAGRNAESEAMLRDLIRQQPTYDEAQAAVFQSLLRKGQVAQAVQSLQAWLAAAPSSTQARLLQVEVLTRSNLAGEADAAMDKLFAEEPENPAVLGQLVRLHLSSNRESQLLDKLEQQRAVRPDNRPLVQAMVELYAGRGRTADAVRVLDQTRAAAGDDPDQLYYIAHLYERVEQKGMTERVLLDILKLDPNNPPACNDLGYMWADEGRNMERAEAMIRVAVAAEPDNTAYLDSLGWALYKRGKFDQAKRYLAEAVAVSDEPDPVVLDHLGDALYRLGDRQEALRTWQRAMERLSAMRSVREEMKKLLIQLKEKVRRQQGGQPVDVAPTVEAAGDQKQATN